MSPTAYELDLTSNFKVHPDINIGYLKEYHSSPDRLGPREHDETPMAPVNIGAVTLGFDVEAIRAHRKDKTGKKNRRSRSRQCDDSDITHLSKISGLESETNILTGRTTILLDSKLANTVRPSAFKTNLHLGDKIGIFDYDPQSIFGSLNSAELQLPDLYQGDVQYKSCAIQQLDADNITGVESDDENQASASFDRACRMPVPVLDNKDLNNTAYMNTMNPSSDEDDTDNDDDILEANSIVRHLWLRRTNDIRFQIRHRSRN
ncbi:hypothetical protein QFC21_002216 [Naganishia friedmannii]|uniref:Uncharacterized protein n=1 Tax=Naganishia friedmannii TaxID=89922 RepID=A0ACC2VY77_9TREE|nr:hypothetical protein QFC21_002216 [Naganishia friedmannii]